MHNDNEVQCGGVVIKCPVYWRKEQTTRSRGRIGRGRRSQFSKPATLSRYSFCPEACAAAKMPRLHLWPTCCSSLSKNHLITPPHIQLPSLRANLSLCCCPPLSIILQQTSCSVHALRKLCGHCWASQKIPKRTLTYHLILLPGPFHSHRTFATLVGRPVHVTVSTLTVEQNIPCETPREVSLDRTDEVLGVRQT